MLPYPSLRQGLIRAWCPSLGASGLTLIDRSGQNAHGTLTSMAGQDNWRASESGVALNFDGVNDYVACGATLTGAFTYSAWCWLRTFGPGGKIVHGSTTDGDLQCPIIAPTFTRLQSDTAGTGKNFTGTNSLLIWTHVCATRQSDNLVSVFTNGVRSTTAPQSVTGTFSLNSLGRYAGNTTYLWDGYLDDIRIYDRAITPAEIRLLASRRAIGLTSAGPRIGSFQSYPITTPPSRVWSNESGVWTPGSVRANESGSWRNGDVKVNDGGVWITARYHPEAEDWKSRAEAAGGTVSETTLSAVSDFCTAINAAGIRDRMYRLNLFCGGNLAACLTPLYRGPTADGGYGNLYDTNVNFVAGDYQETGASGGLKGNGSNKHLNTGYPANTLAASNTHLGVGVTSDDTLAGTTRTAIGSYNGSANSLEIGLRNATSPSVFFSRFATSTDRMGDNSGAYSLLAKGDLIAAWPQFYRNGVAAGSPATTSQNYPLSHSVAVFANNQANTSVISHTDARLAWYSIGATMTAAQASAFSAAIAAFRTALGRV